MFSRVVNYIEGDIGGYPIPQYCKNNWQVPKYHVLNQRNTNTAFMIDHVCLKVVSIKCVYLSQVYMHQKSTSAIATK